eukprot:EC118516.1.p2 GENE.EC118516.1~~EC118516.1.p2  ORF type:complete len:139 (+),score=34.04 EC118516.1:54-470(+)
MAFVAPISFPLSGVSASSVKAAVCSQSSVATCSTKKTSFVCNPIKSNVVVRNTASFGVFAMAGDDLSIRERIQKEIVKAREVSKTLGEKSKEAAAAWDAVGELEAEASHQKAAAPKKDPLDKFCEDNPEADECRIYDD